MKKWLFFIGCLVLLGYLFILNNAKNQQKLLNGTILDLEYNEVFIEEDIYIYTFKEDCIKSVAYYRKNPYNLPPAIAKVCVKDYEKIN